MAKIAIEKFVRHKTANWDGVIYQTEDGKRRVSTKYMDWELTPERAANVKRIIKVTHNRPVGVYG